MPVAGSEQQRRVAAQVGLVERRALEHVLLDPVDVAVARVAPHVGLFGDERAGLGLWFFFRFGRREVAARAAAA